jgi:hypothetical protein
MPSANLLSADWLRYARLPPSRLGIENKFSCARLVVGSEKRVTFGREDQRETGIL